MELCLSPPHDAHGGESTGNRSDRVVGLGDERALLERLVGVVGGGDGRALVVRGPAGSGKTTLVECAIKSATQFRALRVAGVESERDLAYAGLHRLCAPMLDRLDQLPAPQRQALAAAFGLHSGGQVDMLFLGLAVLGLFAYVSADGPLVCAVDDADRLDEPSRRVLALVARRLPSERIAMVFTVAEQMDDLAGLPELVLRPLTDAEARALLASLVPGPLDTPVRDRIVAESRGNPRALIGATGVMAEQLAGGFGLPAIPPPTDPTTRRMREVLSGAPEQTERFMLVAAAEPEGDRTVLLRAAAALEIDPASAHDAASLGLVRVGSRVTFDDPRMRSVVYHDARLDERRRVHAALADACDPAVDPDRPTWHRALAALGARRSGCQRPGALGRAHDRPGWSGGVGRPTCARRASDSGRVTAGPARPGRSSCEARRGLAGGRLRAPDAGERGATRRDRPGPARAAEGTARVRATRARRPVRAPARRRVGAGIRRPSACPRLVPRGARDDRRVRPSWRRQRHRRRGQHRQRSGPGKVSLSRPAAVRRLGPVVHRRARGGDGDPAAGGGSGVATRESPLARAGVACRGRRGGRPSRARARVPPSPTSPRGRCAHGAVPRPRSPRHRVRPCW